MARPLRLEFAGALYHVTSRGNRHEAIYEDDADRQSLMVRSAKDWPWSSYRASAGQVEGPDCLNVEWILAAFAKRKSVAVKRYKAFIADGKASCHSGHH